MKKLILVLLMVASSVASAGDLVTEAELRKAYKETSDALVVIMEGYRSPSADELVILRRLNRVDSLHRDNRYLWGDVVAQLGAHVDKFPDGAVPDLLAMITNQARLERKYALAKGFYRSAPTMETSVTFAKRLIEIGEESVLLLGRYSDWEEKYNIDRYLP